MRWALCSAFSPSQVLAYLVIPGAVLLVTGRARLGRGLCVLGGARLAFDTQSDDTCESAINARVLVGPAPGETWVVVTSAVHMPRTMACFQAAGWNVIPQPADYQGLVTIWGTGSYGVADNLASLDIALHEWIGLVYYRLTGRTRVLFPAP